MNVTHSILCPIDFSEASASALRYAAALAEHLATRVIVMTVEDPMLAAAKDFGSGKEWNRALSEQEISSFVSHTLANEPVRASLCGPEVAVGKPAVEILRTAREHSCDLIVMSSHGLTGARKLFFGSTTERVLRETTIPVLVTPPSVTGPLRIEESKATLQQIVVPVDLSGSSIYQTQAASRIADALELPMVLVHVLEPVESRVLGYLDAGGANARRRAHAEEEMTRLLAIVPAHVPHEAMLVSGDPAEAASKVVRDRHAGLVIMGLHGSPLPGPRMGSVTYRMLCLSPTLIFAIPPRATKAQVQIGVAAV